MAGIYDRMVRDVFSSGDRVPGHLLIAALVFKQQGTFTNQQLLAHLNSVLETPLGGQETTDLQNIFSQLTGQPDVTSKMAYLRKVETAFMYAEAGIVDFTDSMFRAFLGIA